MNTYDGVFKFEDFKVNGSNSKNTSSLKIILEREEKIEEEMRLIPLRGSRVKIFISPETEDNKVPENMCIEVEGTVFKIDVRQLSSGNRLRLIVQMEYTKDLDLQCARLRWNEVDIELEEVEPPLDFGQPSEGEYET